MNVRLSFAVASALALLTLSTHAQDAEQSDAFNQGRDANAVMLNTPVLLEPVMEVLEQADDSDDQTRAIIEEPLPKQVIAEDLMVQGSLCAGFDCAAAETFGSDTVRIKENNLRIHFDDTSASASFPANDWRITVNDQTNGGSDYFSVNDATGGLVPLYLAAGAFNHSLYVAASTGSPRVGIGTNNPNVALHVFGDDSPTLRLQQVGGFGNYNWDVVGNETNFFIRDLPNNTLPFRIRPGVAGNTLMLASNSRVGVGIATGSGAQPQAVLHVGGSGEITTDQLLRVDGNGTTILSLNDSGDMVLEGTLSQLSSGKAKEHFANIDTEDLLETLAALEIFTWNYKHQDDAERHMGPTAEGFYAAFGLGTDPQHIAVSDVAGVALAASQALAQRVIEKEQQIEALESRMQAMERLMQSLLSQVENAQVVVNH